LEVERRIEAKDVIRIQDAAVIERGGPPEFIRSDNGPEFIARAVQEWIERRGFATLYIAPGAPWQNAYSESFNSRFRDECLKREAFGTLLEAKVLGKDYRHRHTHQRPHSSLDYQTPAEYAARQTNRSTEGCAPPNPALLAAVAFGGTEGASAPKAAIHITNQTHQTIQKLS
jgi:transposase InsO family protein